MLIAVMAAAFAALGATSTLAAETGQMPMQGMMGPQGMGPQGMMGEQGAGGSAMMGHHRGMMGAGMMNCPMMGGAGAGRSMMGSRMGLMLPPGNEKLQLQMQAEIMQKVGEILAKYAAQVQ
jgi:hypothetical protein